MDLLSLNTVFEFNFLSQRHFYNRHEIPDFFYIPVPNLTYSSRNFFHLTEESIQFVTQKLIFAKKTQNIAKVFFF
jgi:hypothetical protein